MWTGPKEEEEEEEEAASHSSCPDRVLVLRNFHKVVK
jgi:hypothetical protein